MGRRPLAGEGDFVEAEWWVGGSELVPPKTGCWIKGASGEEASSVASDQVDGGEDALEGFFVDK